MTKKDVNQNIDACGVCEGKNKCRFCSEVPGGLLDDCGQCLKPTSEQWNSKLIIIIRKFSVAKLFSHSLLDMYNLFVVLHLKLIFSSHKNYVVLEKMFYFLY